MYIATHTHSYLQTHPVIATHADTHIHTYLHAHTNRWLHTYTTYICMLAHPHVQHTCVYSCNAHSLTLYQHVDTCIIYTCVHTYSHTPSYIYTCTHTSNLYARTFSHLHIYTYTSILSPTTTYIHNTHHSYINSQHSHLQIYRHTHIHSHPCPLYLYICVCVCL